MNHWEKKYCFFLQVKHIDESGYIYIYIMLPFGSQTWLAGISPINEYVVVFYNMFMGK